VALGVAKSMLDDVQELAATKYRMSDMASLASRPTFQKDLALHVSAWRAAHLLILGRLHHRRGRRRVGFRPHPDTARGHAGGGRLRHRRGAALRRVGAPRRGTTSIREGSRMERAFRDIYTGTQHAFISEKVAIDAAQIWLGIIEDQPGL